jgi:hypothetical protein
VIEAIREESERTRDDPSPKGATFAHPNRGRSRVYPIPVTEAEYEAVQRVADAAHLPPSTLVRSWILASLDRERDASRRARVNEMSTDMARHRPSRDDAKQYELPAEQGLLVMTYVGTVCHVTAWSALTQ